MLLIAVGKPGRLLRSPIAEYEERAGRYWSLRTMDVRAERAGKGRHAEQVQEAEAERLRARVPDGLDLVALTRDGTHWDSLELARYLEDLGLRGHAGTAFIIGGALGLHRALRSSATHAVSLSRLTLPHDLARLVLLEQLYRAGTIVRGEPYHKGTD